ncbi:MAG: hypothetical protein LBE65_03025 [Synergistaceae bacterium]|nr:hypothetical protein [Synergistaceae bacterium]
MKRKNWLSWLVLLVMGMFVLMSGGCGGGGGGGDTQVVEPPPPPPPIPIPEPQGNWQDDGNYDTGWYSNTPYEISTAQELAGLAKLVNNGTTFEGETIRLTEDIDLGDHYWRPIGVNDRDGWVFKGMFDGQGHTVSNTIINTQNSDAYGGLFGINFGTVKNIKVKDVLISVKNTENNWCVVGGLVGYNLTGTVVNCTATGSVSATSNAWAAVAGGLVGLNRGGTIIDCKDVDVIIYAEFTSLINIYCLAGGFAGAIEGAVTTNCSTISTNITASVNTAENEPSDTPTALAVGSFAGRFNPRGTVYNNTAYGSPKIGIDDRKPSGAPSDDI